MHIFETELVSLILLMRILYCLQLVLAVDHKNIVFVQADCKGSNAFILVAIFTTVGLFVRSKLCMK